MGKEQKMIYKKILLFFFIFFGPVEFWFGPVKFEKLEFYWPERASEKNHECRRCLIVIHHVPILIRRTPTSIIATDPIGLK